MSNTDQNRKIKLILLFGLFVSPIVLSYLTFYVWQPDGRVNYGDLIDPAEPIPVAAFSRDEALQGKWVLMAVSARGCGEQCMRNLYIMRQVRLAQGKDQSRVERVLLLGDTQPLSLPDAYSGTRAVQAASGTELDRLPGGHPHDDHIYIVDPLGNVMMRYPHNPDPGRMIKDMQRLLKVSQIG